MEFTDNSYGQGQQKQGQQKQGQQQAGENMKTTKLSIFIVSACFLFGSALVACGGSDDPPASGSGGTGGNGGGSVKGGNGGGTAQGGKGGGEQGGKGGGEQGGNGGGEQGGNGGGEQGGNGGGEQGGNGGGDAQAECKKTDGSPCGDCVAANCVDFCVACITDKDCITFAKCAQKATSNEEYDACMEGLPEEAPGKFALWAGALGCPLAKCKGKSCFQNEPACGKLFNSSECGTCLNTQCMDECNACLNDANCLYVWSCTEGCTTNACLEACDAKFSGGMAKLMDFIGNSGKCIKQKCTMCNEKPDCSKFLGPETNACANCSNQKCQNECNTCTANEDCMKMVDCMFDCYGDQACVDKCVSDNPNGVNDFQAWFGTCLSSKCKTECGG